MKLYHLKWPDALSILISISHSHVSSSLYSQRCRSSPAWCCPVKWSSPRARSPVKVWASSQRPGLKRAPRWALSRADSCPLNTWTCSRTTISCGRWGLTPFILQPDEARFLLIPEWDFQSIYSLSLLCALRCSTKTAQCAISSTPVRRISAAGWHILSVPGMNRSKTWR